MTVDHNERIAVAGAMILYGGSFHQAMGEMLLRADLANAQKVKENWPDVWKHFLEERSRQQRRGLVD